MVKQEDFDLLSQYVDGELDTQSELQVKQRLLADPEFNQQFQLLKGLNSSVQSALPDYVNEPVSDELASLLDIQSTPQSSFVSSFSWKACFPYAASIAVAFVMGVYFLKHNMHDDAGLLLQDTVLSSLPSNQAWTDKSGVKVMVVQSYLSQGQQLCREYYARDSEYNEHGISCQEGQKWVKRAFELQYHQARTDYVPATEAQRGGVEAFILNETLNALSEEEEQKLLQQ